MLSIAGSFDKMTSKGNGKVYISNKMTRKHNESVSEIRYACKKSILHTNNGVHQNMISTKH